MLRGSSRHDGIPNKQSARERDRDRLRERQRQERQQMLPNDDKDISVGAQDLFRAPVKVKPSVDDTTTAQITNTLGSFDTVRHLFLDTSSRRSTNLIGVDQGSLPGTPVALRQPPQPVSGGAHNSIDHSSSNNKHPSYFHPQGSSSSGQSSSSGESASKGHHNRNLFTNSTTTNSHSSNSNLAANTSGNTTANTNNFVSNNSSDFNFVNYRNSLTNNKGTSSSSHTQGAHLTNSSSTSSSSNHTSNSNSATTTSSSSVPSQSGALGGSVVGYPHNSSGGNTNSSSASSASNLGNTNSGNSLRNSSSSYVNSVPNNNQVRQTASSFNNSFNSNSNITNNSTSSVTDSNEGSVNVSSAKTANSNVIPLNKESYNTSASGADEKNLKNASSNKKPALERADSQLEIESMLKEMMDVTAPLTEIQTPSKETAAKKFTQRRSSKSEEKIVQSIRDSGMAHAPSPVQRMDSSGDSSSSYDESETSDSESEDSSSGSQTGGEKIDTAIPKITPSTNSPTRWNLGSFIRKNDYRGADVNATTTALGGSKSPKDNKPNAHQVNAINSETSPGDVPVKTDSIVTSTSLFNKAQSLSPLDTQPAPTPPITRKITRSQVEIKTEPSCTPPKPPSSAPTSKQQNSISAPVTKSLSDSSGDEVGEQKQQKKDSTTRPNIKTELPETKAANATGAATRKRKRNSSSAERNNAQKQPPIEESPTDAKNKKNINNQDRNKNDTLRRLFFINKKVDSPTRSDNGELGKSPSSASQTPIGNGTTISVSTGPTNTSLTSGSTNGSSGVPIAPPAGTSSGGSSSSSNRVQAKDSGKKSKEVVSNNIHNGEIDISAPSLGATATETATKSKRDEGGGMGGAKEKESSSSSRASHAKKNQKSVTPVPGPSSSAKSSSASLSVLLPPPPPPAAKIKEEPMVKVDKSSALSSSLVVKINLNKLKRKPNMMPAPPPPPPLAPPPLLLKIEKDSTEKGGRLLKDHSVAGSSNADLFSKRVHFVSSRVGSSSDHSKDAKETAPSATHNPPPGRSLQEGSLCSGIDSKGRKRSKSKKIKSSSPKKTKTKHEPDSHSKVEEDPACGEVSSNVLGYASCDSVSVSTTRTPPVETDVVQAPDSSLNPPHLPSPVVLPQPVYYSYFERSDQFEEYYARRDQDSYLEEAKRLKHKADGERVSTTQASVYLEAGLYFILTGISMERDRTVGSTAAFTMYKDTLVLIRYIGSRFRNRGAEYSNPMEAKIIVLSMRCQSLLSLKLFKIKMRETKDMVQYLQDHFQRHPTLDLPPIVSSPQLSTPSPHSPTSSPAASSSLHPSPHHPNQIMTSIPRTLYANMQKTCGSTMHLISAHELWETADHLVEKYHIEEFFIQLDRQFGPLTLHNSLVDLVRYVKHALQVLKSTSELS